MRSKAVLDDFTAFCNAHPQLRFWQALRAWSGHNFIFAMNVHRVANTKDDTYYWEGKDK